MLQYLYNCHLHLASLYYSQIIYLFFFPPPTTKINSKQLMQFVACFPVGYIIFWLPFCYTPLAAFNVYFTRRRLTYLTSPFPSPSMQYKLLLMLCVSIVQCTYLHLYASIFCYFVKSFGKCKEFQFFI